MSDIQKVKDALNTINDFIYSFDKQEMSDEEAEIFSELLFLAEDVFKGFEIEYDEETLLNCFGCNSDGDLEYDEDFDEDIED
jgi:hypothetical protein